MAERYAVRKKHSFYWPEVDHRRERLTDISLA